MKSKPCNHLWLSQSSFFKFYLFIFSLFQSDLETQAYDKLNQLLSTLENSAKPSPELERINDLLKVSPTEHL